MESLLSQAFARGLTALSWGISRESQYWRVFDFLGFHLEGSILDAVVGVWMSVVSHPFSPGCFDRWCIGLLVEWDVDGEAVEPHDWALGLASSAK